MPDQKYMAHVIIISGFVGLPCFYDPLRVKEYQFFYIFHFKNDLLMNKNIPLGEILDF